MRKLWINLACLFALPGVALSQGFTSINVLDTSSLMNSRYVNASIPAGNTTSSTTETAWASQYVVPAGTLGPGTILTVSQSGVYQAGLAQSITPRIRIGPAATALTSRTIIATTGGAVSGLLNAAVDTPWSAETRFVVMADGSIVPYGLLFFSTSATAALSALVSQKTGITGVNFNVDNVLTSSAQWTASNAGNTITCTHFIVRIEHPAIAN